MSICSSSEPAIGFVGTITNFADCQAQALGAGAYSALAAPGSTLSLMLTAFTTILVALFGYNLMLGHSPSLRTGVATIAKLGIVLALATNWHVYQTLVYDVVVEGPGQIVSEIGKPIGLPGGDRGLTARLDLADAALVRLSVMGPGNAPFVRGGGEVALPPFAGFNMFAIGTSRIVFLSSALASLVIVRIVAGLMLALGPLFLAFLMFANTRSLFEGWVRVISGAAIASLGVSIALGLELSLLEPWLAQILARREAGEVLPGMPAELMVVFLLFTLVLVGVMFATRRLTAGFRMAPIVAVITDQDSIVERTHHGSGTLVSVEDAQPRSRAASVAQGLLVTNRRDRALALSSGERSIVLRPQSETAADASRISAVGTRLGPRPANIRQRTRARVSASAGRRDIQQ